MKYCMQCANTVTPLETPSGHEARYRCDGCGQRYQMSFGDNKACSDLFRCCGNRPFEIERVWVPRVEMVPGQRMLAESDFDFGGPIVNGSDLDIGI